MTALNLHGTVSPLVSATVRSLKLIRIEPLRDKFCIYVLARINWYNYTRAACNIKLVHLCNHSHDHGRYSLLIFRLEYAILCSGSLLFIFICFVLLCLQLSTLVIFPTCNLCTFLYF